MNIRSELTEVQIDQLIKDRQNDLSTTHAANNTIEYLGDNLKLTITISALGLIALKIESHAKRIMLNIQFIIDNWKCDNAEIRIIPGLTFVYDVHYKRQWCVTWLYDNPKTVTSELVIDAAISQFISRCNSDDEKDEASMLYDKGIDIVKKYSNTNTFSSSLID